MRGGMFEQEVERLPRESRRRAWNGAFGGRRRGSAMGRARCRAGRRAGPAGRRGPQVVERRTALLLPPLIDALRIQKAQPAAERPKAAGRRPRPPRTTSSQWRQGPAERERAPRPGLVSNAEMLFSVYARGIPNRTPCPARPRLSRMTERTSALG